MGGEAGGQAKRAVVNEEWERGEIVMCIAIPDTSILAKSSQLIKYSSSSNSQIKALKRNSNTTSLEIFVMQHKLVGHFLVEVSGLLHKTFRFCRACSTHKCLMEFSGWSLSSNSIIVHQETKRKGMISRLQYCINIT